MKRKKLFIFVIIAIIGGSISNNCLACEPDESKDDPKDESDSDYEWFSVFSSAMLFLNNAMERYPILEKIFQIILQFIYNKLGALDLSII
jgi:hypothetical protein